MIKTKQKTFGTDIHRHTVEFSKNTRTPVTSELSGGFWGNRSILAYPVPAVKAGFHLSQFEASDPRTSVLLDCGLSAQPSNLVSREPCGSGLSAPGRCPCRSDLKKVTWTRTPRQIAWSGDFRTVKPQVGQFHSPGVHRELQQC